MSINLAHVDEFKKSLFPNEHGGRWYEPSGMVHLGIASRGVELSKPDIWVPEFEFAVGQGLPLTAHLESSDAVDQLAGRGFLHEDLLAVHAIGATDAQLDALAESSTPVCVALPATGRAADGKSRLSEFMQHGILVCLSVDSLAGCDTSDYFTIMRMSLVIERIIHQDPLAYQASDVLAQATINGARALGLDQVTGSVTPGKRADLTLMRGLDLNMAPLNNPVAQVVLCGQPRNVESVWVDGRALKKDGRLTRVDEHALVTKARERVALLAQRTGRPVR
jgi:cytosine/adenosine deaminase-related metal-dependent hydrolase